MCSIAFINNLLSRLFGGEQDNSEDDGQLLEQELQPEQAPVPVKPHYELQLSSEHPLRRLWDFSCQQSGPFPGPEILLDEQTSEDLSEAEANRELRRLQQAISASASERLSRIQTKLDPAADAPLPAFDAKVAVITSSDNLIAWIVAYPPVGEGAELSREILDKSLAESKIRFGIDEALLDSLPENRERYFRLFPVARGQQAVHGVDGHIVDLFPRIVEKKVKADEQNRVDYTSVDFVHNIEVGGVICKIIHPTKGSHGRTVQDQAIPAREGKAPTVPKGRNTQVSEDGNALLATISGHVEFSGRTFQVRPLLAVSGNVDFSTGNINFLGDVSIRGDICCGFTVRATGNITVGGVVEAATVEAGGDLVVAGGVQGDNQAVIRAQRNIFVKYLENCSVYVRDTLHTDCIINCDVYCDSLVEVRTGRMTVVGGCIRAATELNAGTVGSRAECRTEVILGGRPCETFDYDILVREIKELEQDMEKTERQPDSPNKLSRISKLRMQLLINKKKLEQFTKERDLSLAEGDEGEEPPPPPRRRMICDTVYPGTVLTIDNVMTRFEDRLSPCRAALDNGEIRLI